MVWCTISSTGIVRPIFLDDIVSAECYLQLLQDHIVPTLQRMGINMEETFFPTRWGKTTYGKCSS
jgi:hypothetical protein